jgi:hypothetical protein
MGRHPGSRNDHPNATAVGSFGKLLHLLRGPVSRKRIDLKRDLQIIQESGSRFHHREIGGAAHDNADKWLHAEHFTVAMHEIKIFFFILY